MSYYLILSVYASLAILEYWKIPTKKAFFFLSVLTTLFIGGRILPFIDDYKLYTENFINNGSSLVLEYGFKVLTKSIRNITSNANYYFLIIAILTFTTKNIIIYSESSLPFFSAFIYITTYFIGFDMIAVRQGIALTITLYSYNLLVSGKRISFILTVILASLFHFSALIFLPALLLWKLNLTPIKSILIILTSIAFGEITKVVLINAYDNHYKELPFFVQYKLRQYLFNKDLQINILSFATIKKFVILAILINSQKVINNNEKLVGMRNFIIVAYSLFFALRPIADIAQRIGTYYEIFEIFLLPYLIYTSKYKKVLFPAIFIIYVLKYLGTVSFFNFALSPYKNYFL